MQVSRRGWWRSARAGRVLAGALILAIGALFLLGKGEEARLSAEGVEARAILVSKEVRRGTDSRHRQVHLRLTVEPGPEVPSWATREALSGVFPARFEQLEVGKPLLVALAPTRPGDWTPIQDHSLWELAVMALLVFAAATIGGGLVYSGLVREKKTTTHPRPS